MASASLPNCKKKSFSELSNHLSEFGKAWAASPDRPKVGGGVAAQWDELLDQWIASVDLPLLIRRDGGDRGQNIAHSESGRSLIHVDNATAQWAFAKALLGQVPSVDDIRKAITNNTIPVAKAFRANEKTANTIGCHLTYEFDLNKRGWKLAHIQAIGLGSIGDTCKVDIGKLQTHFKQFLSPKNMFLIPSQFGGVAESEPAIAAYAKAINDAQPIIPTALRDEAAQRR